MNKILLLISFALIICGCGKLEFIYETNRNDFLIKNNTNIQIKGDDSSNIHVLLRNIIGDNKNDDPKYRLVVNSTKKESPEVIKKDATASKFKIQYLIIYDFYNLYKDCKIISKEISTMSSYSAKSAGYSFGTDLSQKESSSQNITKNINKFISYLNELPKIDRCEK